MAGQLPYLLTIMDMKRAKCDVCRRWTDDPGDGLAVLCVHCRVELEIELEKMLKQQIGEQED